MKAVGGYFELELSDNNTFYHDSAIRLNSGRNALEYILRQQQFNKIYLPIYSCDVILQPILKLGLDYEYYQLNDQLLPIINNVNSNEAILYINYFGIMDASLKALNDNNINLIVDNSQAFFTYPLNNVPTFYSPRKFFGLPDGGIAYVNEKYNISLEKDVSFDRVSHLLKRLDLDAESGFRDFQENDKALDNLPLKKMSNVTELILNNIGFNKVKKIRVANFNRIHSKLKHLNLLTSVIENSSFEAAMVYPFLRKNNLTLRNILNKKRIYTATYWPNVKNLVQEDDFEYFLLQNLIALPIDQRVTFDDTDRIINEIERFING